MTMEQGMVDGRAIALSVDPNLSNDVCTFCLHARFPAGLMDAPGCTLGHTPYFRSLTNIGPIWVSNCNAGEVRPELLAEPMP